MDFDAVLLLSFGGPEGPEQVRPFLENVTRGRNVPPERLDDVAQHYLHFGGVSPINGINRDLIAQLQAVLDVPVYFGNRNWEPYVEDAVADHARQRDSARGGVHHLGVEWILRLHPVFRGPRPGQAGGRAGCARTGQTAAILRPSAVRRDIRRQHRHRRGHRAQRRPAGVHRALGAGGRRRPAAARKLYSRQVRYAAGLVAAAAGYADYDLAWQSRSGPPQVPWLEPDVADHVAALDRDGDQGRHRLPDRFRRRPHRGGVGSRYRVARTSRRGRHSACAGRHAQRRPAIRPARGGPDRRTSLRPCARAGGRAGSGAWLRGQHQRRAVPSAALRRRVPDRVSSATRRAESC